MLQQLDVEHQQGQGQRQLKTRPTGEIGNVSIQSKYNNNNALPPFLVFFLCDVSNDNILYIIISIIVINVIVFIVIAINVRTFLF